jgi:hypothetical protein
MTASFLVLQEWRTIMFEEEPPQLRAIGYCRVACADNDTNKNLEYQMQRIDKRAMAEDLEFLNCYEEIGKAGEVLQELYEFCEEDNNISYILVSDFTRISRNVREVEAWISKFLKLGVEVMWADKSPIDESVSNRNKSFTEIYVPNLGRFKTSVPEKSKGRE